MDSIDKNVASFAKLDITNTELTYETCTIASCGPETNTGGYALDLQLSSTVFSSTNFTNNQNNSICYSGAYQPTDNIYIKLKYCSFYYNNLSILSVLNEKCFIGHCNLIQNGKNVLYFLRVEIQIYHSCFAQNTDSYDLSVSESTIYIINCSFDKTLNLGQYQANINTNEIRNSKFSLTLEHLFLKECEAVFEKTPTQYEYLLRNNKLEMNCSCQYNHQGFTLQSISIPTLLFQALIR